MASYLSRTRAKDARPVWLIKSGDALPEGISKFAANWVKASEFDGRPGSLLLLPADSGEIAGALFCYGHSNPDERLGFGKLGSGLPEGNWYFANSPAEPELAALGFLFGGYRFDRYKKPKERKVTLACPDGTEAERVARFAQATFLARDLINTPANDMGPNAIEAAARQVAKLGKAKVRVIKGAALERGFPMIHAVGRAAGEEPRLLDFSWG